MNPTFLHLWLPRSPEDYLEEEEEEEEDETVQRARAWLNSRGLCDTSPAVEQGEVSSKSPEMLREPWRRVNWVNWVRRRLVGLTMGIWNISFKYLWEIAPPRVG